MVVVVPPQIISRPLKNANKNVVVANRCHRCLGNDEGKKQKEKRRRIEKAQRSDEKKKKKMKR
jgi:hypothetical protein